MRYADGFIKDAPPSRLLLKADVKGTAEVVSRVKDADKKEKKKKRLIRCSNCGLLITTTDQRVEVNGDHLHIFKNPAGVIYRIGCFAEAQGCFHFGEPTEEYTWFPGYAWSYANCRRCFSHLGWLYRSGEKHFYGLILNHLIESEEEAQPPSS